MADIIETTKYGLANTIKGIIYLHPILNDFPKLKERVIAHERKHQKGKGFWKQRKIDSLTKIRFRELIPVYRKKPLLLLKQYSPITYIDNTLLFEWSLIFLYIFYLLIGGLIFWLIKLFSKNSIFFWKVVQYMFLIFLIIIILYFVGKSLRNYINKEVKKEVTKK